MIQDIRKSYGKLIWTSDDVYYQIDYSGNSFLHDDKFILILDESLDKVVVLDDKGKQIEELSNSDEVSITYILKHPRFGLSVVASIKNEKGEWNDKCLSFTSDGFKVISNVR